MSRCGFFLLFVFFCKNFICQIDSLFIQHLAQNKFKTEHRTYLKSIRSTNNPETNNYFWSRYYLQYNQIDDFINSLKSSKSLFVCDTNFSNHASRLFLTQNPQEQDEYFNILKSEKTSFYSKKILNLYYVSQNPKRSDTSIVPWKLKNSFNNLLKASNKKPFLAGLYSALFPGTGKLYIGRTKSFFNVFLAHVFNGVAIYEATRNFGIEHPYTIFCLSYSGVFYLANVYGSFHDTKRNKAEKRKQFLNEASNHYRLYCSNPFAE